MALIYLSGAWLAGILLGSKTGLPFALIFSGLAPLPLLCFFPRHSRLIIVSAACIIAFFGGVLCYQASLPPDDGSHISSYVTGEARAVQIEGMVSADPEVRDEATQLRLSVSQINPEGEGWRGVSGDILLFVPRYPEYEYGDVLRLKGELEMPTQDDDFDYKGYLEHQGIYATMRFYGSDDDIEILAEGQGFKPLAWIYTFRNNLADSIARAMPEPQASLTQGVLLGIRYNIPDDIRDEFAQTGTAHLLAISGLHLSIIAGMLLSLGVWLFGRRRFIYIWLALGVIWLYTLLSGFHPPVVRGAIMASLFLGAELLGRQRTAITALAFAAAVMVGLDPPIIFDAAFQMSFMAMAGLIFLSPTLMGWGHKAVGATLGEKGAVVSLSNIVSDGLAVTLAAVIAVWPLIAYYYGVVSFVGPLTTFLAALALPFIIIVGAAAGLVGLFFVPLAQGIGWVGWLFNSYMLFIVGGFAALPLSSVAVGRFSPALIAVYYAALIVIVGLIGGRGWWQRFRGWLGKAKILYRLPWKWVVPPLLIVAVLVVAAVVSLPDDKLHVSVLDVGQGDAILIQRGSQQVLIDGGPSPQTLTRELGERMPFWDRTIELVVLTHPDNDHINGLVEVLGRYRVERVLYPDLTSLEDFDDPLHLYQEWQELIEEKNIASTTAQAGQEIDLGEGITMTVLNPPATLLAGTDDDVNNNGAVLRLEAGQLSFLFTADITWEGEFALISRGGELASTVLKVAHHGSYTSTSPEFLEAVSPQVAVISVGRDNPYGHPYGGVVARLEANLGEENLFRTDEQGTIEFITDGERLWVRTDG